MTAECAPVCAGTETAAPIGRAKPSMVLGAAALCLLGATLTPSFHAPPISVNVVWSFLFAALIALAHGRRASLAVGLAGIVPVPFILWPDNGWADLIGGGYYLLWLYWLGWSAEKHAVTPRWWNEPLTVQVGLLPVQALVFLVLFPAALAQNPPPWRPSAVQAIPSEVLAGLVVKDAANLLFCLLCALLLLKLGWVRRSLGLGVPRHYRLNGKVAGACLASLAVLWLALRALNGFLIEGALPADWVSLHGPYEAVALFLMTIASLAAALAICRFTEGRLLAADHLSEAEHSLRATLERLRAANLERERFTTIAAHDLQEPVRTVVSFAQLLEQNYGEALPEAGRDYMRYMIEGARRMKETAAALLDYSQIVSRDIRIEPVDTATLLDEVLSSLRPMIAGPPATIDLGCRPMVMGDRDHLRHLFLHVLGNALKFRSPDAEVRIRVDARRVDGGQWEFAVVDNGIGIPAEYRDSIFDAFRRLHPIGRYPGVGIGLALARHIVQEHGGRIWLESGVRGRTEFRFTLPSPP